jgi:NhaA family Na+:H+ antiporter
LGRFLHVAAAGGFVLLLATAVALALANSPWSEQYLGLWKTEVGFRLGSFEMFHSLKHWISDGLMAIFFFVVGLEVKRELVLGELNELRRAVLPIAAAVGGMVVPAGIYIALQAGEPGQRGWGIPMATDIAFVVGCMAVLGPRIPRILRILLLSLAIVDDIGAILVIAIGYTEEIHTTALLLAFLGIGVVFVLGRLGVRSFTVYIVLGTLVWLGFHESGVHATIAGVILGLMTPARSYVSTGLFGEMLQKAHEVVHGEHWQNAKHRGGKIRNLQRATRETIPPLEFLEDTLHPWTSFLIMPLFALCNAGVAIEFSDFANPVAMAIMAGLVIGKPVGIVILTWLAVKMFTKKLPEGLNWGAITGGGFLAGIGFTMALFVAGLALEGELLEAAKVGIIGGSAVAAVIGVILLLWALPKKVHS